VDQGGEAVGQRRAESGEVRRVPVEAGERGVRVRLAEERDPPGEAFVEHEPERVEIGAAVQSLATHLFRRQVLGGAHHDVVAGQVVAGRCGEALGDAEVGEQHPTIRCDQDVAGLDVAVDETGAMGRVERRCDAHADVHGQIRAELLLLVEQLAQALAVDELHHDRLAPTLGDRVVDGDDVRVVQPGDGDGLAAEALGDHGVCRERRLEELDGDGARQQGVGGQPHLGHASLREASLQPVALGEHRWWQRRGAGGSGHVRVRTLVAQAAPPPSIKTKAQRRKGFVRCCER